MHREYPTLADLLDAASKPAVPGSADASRTDAQAFSGNASLAEARAMLAGAGSSELAAKVRELALTMAPQTHVQPLLSTAYDVSGGAVDVARFLSGDPECMIDYSSPAAMQRTLDVCINVTVSGGIAPEVIIARGAAICAAIDAMEASGTRVRLSWCFAVTCRHYGHTLTYSGLVKDYASPLDVDLVAFVVAHPAMLRQIVFRLIDAEPTFITMANAGKGQIIDFPTPADTVYIPQIMGMWAPKQWNVENSLATVERLFNGGAV